MPNNDPIVIDKYTAPLRAEREAMKRENERLRSTVGRLSSELARTSQKLATLLEQNRLLEIQRDAARGEVAYWQERRRD